MTFQMVAGCYDGSLHGWAAGLDASHDSGMAASLEFAFAAHENGGVRSAAYSQSIGGSGSRWLATGGADDAIKVFDVIKQREQVQCMS